MNKNDIFKMCLQNLMRRKSRTLLTVLGVLIGCCSIVIMVSIGIGMKESQANTLAEMGDLTLITVTAPQNGKGKVKLDEKFLNKVQQLEHVNSVTPKKGTDDYTLAVTAGVGNRYQSEYTTLVAVDSSKINDMGYQIIKGSAELKEGEVIVGQDFAYAFKDSMRPDGSNMVDKWSNVEYKSDGTIVEGDVPDPYFNPLELDLSLSIKSGDKEFKTTLKPVGIVKEDSAKGYETSDGIIMSISDLNSILTKLNVPEDKKNKYDSILVKVDDLSNVEALENQIKAMGYSTESMESIRKPMEKEAQQKQLMLGGLGAISLFVAALGITNTMIMSISERTKEIGIMKSLGCFVSDIRMLFLSEAAVIGLIGGAVGCVISFVISIIINLVSLGGISGANLVAAIIGGQGISRMSVIPFWLYLFALLFSVAIGLGSGYYPANKAVQIPALEAIKNE